MNTDDIRAWLRESGYDVPGRGPIPRHMQDAYEAHVDATDVTEADFPVMAEEPPPPPCRMRAIRVIKIGSVRISWPRGYECGLAIGHGGPHVPAWWGGTRRRAAGGARSMIWR